MEPEGSSPHSKVPATCPILSQLHFPLLRPYQSISPGPGLTLWMFRNIVHFYSEELLAHRPPPKLEDHTLSAVRYCLFDIFVATFHIGGPFLLPQPEDAPCLGDRDPLITEGAVQINLCCAQLYKCCFSPSKGTVELWFPTQPPINKYMLVSFGVVWMGVNFSSHLVPRLTL
jgi:hypothetical protein